MIIPANGTNTGITTEIQNTLGEITELNALISGDYVRDENYEVTKANIKHLFPKDKDQAKIINPGSYIGGIVFDWISSYMGIPETKLASVDWAVVVEGLMSTGYIRLFINPKDRRLEHINANSFYRNGSEEIFVTLYEQVENGTKKNYLLVETFNEGYLEKKLYELSNPANLSNGKLVPLNTVEALKGQTEKFKIEGLNSLVIESKVEHSILKKIRTIIASIEKKMSEIDKNFLDYTEQFKVFRNLEIPDDAYEKTDDGIKVLDFDKLGKIIQTNDLNGGVGGMEIIKNTNDLLVECIKYIDNQIRQISSITNIPLFAFGIKQEGGQDSGTSKIKSAGLFYKKIEKYQASVSELFNRFWELMKVTKEEDKVLVFPEITTADVSEIVENQTKMLDAGVQSKVRAIQAIHKVNKDDALAILKEIEDETNQGDTNQENNDGSSEE